MGEGKTGMVVVSALHGIWVVHVVQLLCLAQLTCYG